MSKKCVLIPDRHKCGKRLSMRITDCEDDNGVVLSWLIYGHCKKCRVVLIIGMFNQEEKPVQNVDWMLVDEVVEEPVK